MKSAIVDAKTDPGHCPPPMLIGRGMRPTRPYALPCRRRSATTHSGAPNEGFAGAPVKHLRYPRQTVGTLPGPQPYVDCLPRTLSDIKQLIQVEAARRFSPVFPGLLSLAQLFAEEIDGEHRG